MKKIRDCSDQIRAENLTRAVTLDGYFMDRFYHSPDPRAVAIIRERAEPFKKYLAELAKAEDEWWEWIQGTQPLMQSGGLALVRAGKIVWATEIWIS